MQLKAILNRVQKVKSNLYTAVQWAEDAGQPSLKVEAQPRANSRSVCGKPRPGYDWLEVRRFEFMPLCGIKVFQLYAPR